MIPGLRDEFNQGFTAGKYGAFLAFLEERSGTKTEFRVSETPVFVQKSLLDHMAKAGETLARILITNPVYLAAARRAIPPGFCVAHETAHPHFLTADFALVKDREGVLVPRLVEIQAFPSIFGYQALLSAAYQRVFQLPDTLSFFLSGLDDAGYWALLRRVILGRHDPENVVLSEVDPTHQKTLPDFNITAQKLGIAVVDISSLEAVGDKLHYPNKQGRMVPIHRIYNRAIADELIARNLHLKFDLTHPWEVEWAGHPNWYFLISKFSIPWLSDPKQPQTVVPPAVFLNDFLDGQGRAELEAAGVSLPNGKSPEDVYENLLLKPLFSFAGKGIQFDPTQEQLESIPVQLRPNYLLQQRMHFAPTIETPEGLTQAEFRILYVWPDGGELTPALSLVRLGRGKMMGVDHNKNKEWVGASAAFFE